MSPRFFGPGGRSRRGRLLALVAIPALAVSLLSAAPSSAPATASPAATSASPDQASPPADFASPPVDVEPVTVTLITGDTVFWRDTHDGNAGVAEIEEAPRDVPVYFNQSGSALDFYVIPSDVMPQVVAGTLDEELFNIPSLIRQGLDDESTGGQLPVIVTFDQQRSAQRLERDANALPAAGDALAVEGIQGAGMTVDTDRAARFRDAVLTEPGRQGRGPSTNSESDSLAGAVDTILLDRMLELDLSESVPQIGAPEAWEAGFTGEGVTVAVIDTGIDTTHPDLVSQVVAAENFVGDGDPIDDNGHGTHVASTVAGTGAASDGARRGVAPDADLISAKVCDAEGQCPTSAIMAGMEWAAERADVVNISLGSENASDGTDPLSQLLNELSAQTGALFVTSAGNTRCHNQVGSPAAADAALAVGAVDKNDNLARFSSCGPRLSDHAVKPEITAPGVGIIAARAEGSDLAPPVDDVYMSLDGTSMASPHVAGAAALLVQARGFAGQELKDALVSTATDIGRLWREVGTGRVDVPASLGSPVYAQGTLNFGEVPDRAERDLTYTNHGETDVTLALEAAITGSIGEPLDVVSLSADTLTVPAGGQASVTVMVDVTGVPGAQPPIGGGVVTAATDGVDLRTGIGFGPIRHKLTIEVLDSHGDRIGTPTAPDGLVFITNDTFDFDNPVDRADYRLFTVDGIATGYVPTGTFTVFAVVGESNPDSGELLRTSALIEVEADIRSDTNLTLDARDVVPVEQPEVPREVEARNLEVAVRRERANFLSGFATLIPVVWGSGAPVYVTPTPPGELGFIALSVHWVLAEPQPVHPLPFGGHLCGPPANSPFRCFSPTPAYVYNLPFFYENGIPTDLSEKVTRRDLVEVPTRFHADRPDALIMQQFGAIEEGWWVGQAGLPTRLWFEPGEVTEYFLANDRLAWIRNVGASAGADAGRSNSLGLGYTSRDWFPMTEAGTERDEESWFAGPLRVGAVDARDEVFGTPFAELIGGKLNSASASRGGGDGNQFVPGFAIMDNTRGHYAEPGPVGSYASWRMWNLDTGAELDPRPSGMPAFALSSDVAAYRLEQTDEWVEGLFTWGSLLKTGPATTTWEFRSRRSDAEVPFGYYCPDQSIRACQIQPLIQLEYDLDLDIHNQAFAGRAHVFTINAGHHSKAIDRAEVTDLSVEASFDDGETWTAARVVGKPRGIWDTGGFLPSSAPYQEYRVVLQIPPLHRTNGFVTLRVQAKDANGGTVDQTVRRAYILR